MIPKKEKIESILFDLDGTLLSTHADIILSARMLLKDQGSVDNLDEKEIIYAISDGCQAILEALFLDGSAYKERLLYYYQLVIKQKLQSKAFQGIKELVTAIEAKFIPWGIVTNKSEVLTHMILEQLPWTHSAQVIICPEQLEHPKPSPEGLLLACQTLNCNPKKSMYIGDHLRDIQAAKQANMFSVAAHYGYIGRNNNPYDWNANLNILKPNALLAWLNSMQWQISDDWSTI